MQRESMDVDILIIGAGPAGLAAAIRLKQLAQAQDRELNVTILEKGAEVGAHILAGAVIDPCALTELLPNWQNLQAPLHTPVSEDHFLYLSEKKSRRLPTPPQMRNHGNYIISLSQLTRWLGEQAQALGVDIFPGFAASEILYDDNAAVIGVATGDMGINKQGEQSERYQAGMELRAKQTLFAEGCRGSLTKQLIQRFNLTANCQPQTYGIGIKELWRVQGDHYQPGLVVHSVGWPLDKATYGGGFIYHMQDNTVAVGFVVGLDYKNPYLNPFAEMQRYKTHPSFKALFAGGERIGYGSRALNEGGYQSIPQLSFPGGMLIGDAAGFLNVAKIKGIHTAMKSAMVAVECVYENIDREPQAKQINYKPALQKTWLWHELYKVRNIRPAFRWGLTAGLGYAALDTYVLRGHAPWTFKHHHDHQQLLPAQQCPKINYPKPDGKLTFDRLSSVYLTNTFHEEDQPCHLTLKDKQIPIDVNLATYAAPEQRYCPAGVYEIINDGQQARLQINAQNCIHCKTCDIKDPQQNITWVPPEGGGGPNYSDM